MSDKEKFNEEEYHFVDDPDMSSYAEPDHGEEVTPNSDMPNEQSAPEKKNVAATLTHGVQSLFQNFMKIGAPLWSMIKQNLILRMALLGLGVFILILIVYRCSANPLAVKTTEKISPIPTARPKVTQMVAPVVQPKVETVTRVEDTSKIALNQAVVQGKLNDLEKNQASLQTQVSDLSAQMASMNTNVTNMMSNFKILNDQLAQLAVTLQNQAKAAPVLTPRKTHPQARWDGHASTQRSVQYSLQAVIPGRAWLISSAGDTLTVREGTRIARYGVVRYIDAKRGRVLTSSGQMIQFSQNDS